MTKRHPKRINSKRKMRDVHVYDGTFQKPDLPAISQSEKERLFQWAKQMLPENPGLQLVISDSGLSGNYDPISQCRAEELLVAVLTIAELNEAARETAFELIEQQMKDMYNLGRCPQGRVTRLLQIYLAMSGE